MTHTEDRCQVQQMHEAIIKGKDPNFVPCFKEAEEESYRGYWLCKECARQVEIVFKWLTGRSR